jgi:TPR repeat protein
MEAQFKLGDLYSLGHGISKSISKTYEWYTKAAIQGYKKALIRIHNLYQEDIRIRCRGQINSEEGEWVSKNFRKNNNIRELNEYRLQQNESILNGAINYFEGQFRQYISSNQDDPITQLNLAFLYQHGYGVRKNIRWALEYYTKSAEQGNTDAQYNLGHLYQKHTDIKFNYRQAFYWYKKSAQGGNIAAQRSLAYFYLKGLATDMDNEVALNWYLKAAEAGDFEAQVVLGKLYRKGGCVEQDLTMAVEWYTLAARQGSIVAQNCLSQLYQRGMLDDIELEEDMGEYTSEYSIDSRLCTKLSLDVSKLGDSSKFKQLNELAKYALIGDGHAMYEIGLKYLNGDKDFSQDQDAGIKWIKNAANAKHKESQRMFADLYKKGEIVEQDYRKSSIWYKALAKRKDAGGRFNIGVLYHEGLGVRKDPLEASRWFTWAANQGNGNTQYNLGMLRLNGRGLGQNEKEATEWFTASANQRNPQACYKLGNIYF